MEKWITIILIGTLSASLVLTYDLGCLVETLKAAHDAAAVTAGINQGGMITACFAQMLMLVMLITFDE